MPFNVDIFNKEIQTSKSDYDTYSVVVTADLLPYATINSVSNSVGTLNDTLNTRITSLSGTVNSNFLPLTGGRLTGNLTLSGTDGQDKSLILYSPTVGASAELKAAITFIGFNPGTGQFEPEPGVSFPRILIREGRLDLDPDNIFTRAEFRVSNVNSQFNIYNKDLAKYYLRIRPNGGFEAGGTNLTASGADSHAEGFSTTANGSESHAEGQATQAAGGASHAEGIATIAQGLASHAAGFRAVAAQSYTYIWSDGDLGNSQLVSTTRAGQYMVSASGGMFIPGNVGIGTDSIDNSLTVTGTISTLNQGNSIQWNNTFTNVRSNSANWNSTYATVCSLSARWDADSTNLATITDYLSTNNVLMSGTTVTANISAQGLFYSRSILPELPIPKIKLTNINGNGTMVQYLSTDGDPNLPAVDVKGDITVYNYPVLIVQDIPQELFNTYQIFVEMVAFKGRNGSNSYVVPKGSNSVPWGNDFWTRSGSAGIVNRYNHFPVLSAGEKINLTPCLNNHFIEKPIWYYDANNTSQVVDLIVPTRSSKGFFSNRTRFGYSGAYKSLYIAFRYIAWLPNNNNGRGQIVSGPLSPTIRVANKRWPFRVNHYQSSVHGEPVVDYFPITKTDFICKFV